FAGTLPLADQDPNVIDAELRKRARLFSARHLVNLHKHIALRALPDTAVRPAIASSASLSKLSGTPRRYVDDDDIGYRRPAAVLCCARPASGHAAAAPPTAARNSRRPMVTVIRPSRARCVKVTIPRRERAVPNSAASGARAGSARPGTGCNGAPPDPTQLPAKKRILCDRHHIANAMAEQSSRNPSVVPASIIGRPASNRASIFFSMNPVLEGPRGLKRRGPPFSAVPPPPLKEMGTCSG